MGPPYLMILVALVATLGGGAYNVPLAMGHTLTCDIVKPTFYVRNSLRTLFNILTLPNPTAFTLLPPALAALNISILPSQTEFGQLVGFDSPVTTSANVNAPVIGRARGFNLYTSLDTPGFETVFTIVFNSASGYPAGTSLSFQGFISVAATSAALGITTGTGKFGFGSGFASTAASIPAPDTVLIQLNVAAQVCVLT